MQCYSAWLLAQQILRGDVNLETADDLFDSKLAPRRNPWHWQLRCQCPTLPTLCRTEAYPHPLHWPVRSLIEYGGQTPPKGYFRGRVLDQYSVNAVSLVFRNHSATSFAWKGRSSRSRSRLSNSVISSAVLGFLILFNARKMCSLRRRLEFGIFFITGSTVSKN